MKLKTIAIAIALLMLGSISACQSKTSPGASSGTQGQAVTNAGTTPDQITAYMRKAFNIPPQVQISVGNITSSEIKGLNQAVVHVSMGQRKQTQTIYLSPDGKYLILGRIFDLTQPPPAPPQAPVSNVDMNKINMEGAPTRGASNAKVTIVEYTDFECPFCGRAYGTVEDLMHKYDGKVKLVYKSFPLPFHPWAMTAAIGARCAYVQSQKAFWYFYDHLFQGQNSITPDSIKDTLKGYAKATHLNMGKFNACLDPQQTKSAVQKDIEEGKGFGISGTPTFVINGQLLQGAQPEEQFTQIIDKDLK